MHTSDQDQDSLLVKRRNDNHSPGPVIRELVPSSHQRSELSNTILGIFSRWDRESGRAFQSLIVSGKKLPLLTSVLAMGVWNAIECWFLQRLVLGIIFRSSVGTLALPLRPLYSNISLLSFLLFLRQHYKSERWASCRNQTPSWYDWKMLKVTLNPNKLQRQHNIFNINSKRLNSSYHLFWLNQANVNKYC